MFNNRERIYKKLYFGRNDAAKKNGETIIKQVCDDVGR